MNIYVIGNSHQSDEIRSKINTEHPVELVNTLDGLDGKSEVAIFDFSFDDSPDDLEIYAGLTNIHLFINATRASLMELAIFSDNELPNLYGIAGDPTFLERPLLEVSAHKNNSADAKKLFSQLGLDATLVEDRVGLVTPRIISMIINENIRIADVLMNIQASGGNLVLDVDLFDIFENEKEGLKSLAFHIIFGSDKRTLENKEADELMKKIIAGLEKDLKVRIRK